MTYIPTTDLCDAYPDTVKVVTRPLRPFGGITKIAGEILTLRVSGCNQGIIDQVQTPGKNRILVVENIGADACAITGDKIVQKAIDNGWQGMVILGYIRDSAAIKQMPFGIWALGTNPMRGRSGRPYTLSPEILAQTFTISSGEWFYADEDGLVIMPGQMKV